MRGYVLAAAILLGATYSSAARADQFPRGEALYQEHCSLCHGKDGRGGVGFKTPLWGQQTQIKKFDNAMAMFEYNQLLMPFQDPSKVTDEEKWAIMHFILVSNGTIPRNQVLGPDNAAKIQIK